MVVVPGEQVWMAQGILVTLTCEATTSFHTLASRAGLRASVVTYRCKRFGVPVEKIYNKTQRERFAWAFNQAGEDFEF